MRIVDIIKKKRDGEKLNKNEIDFFIENYVNGNIYDYQASALLMAIYFNGLDDEETLNLTSDKPYVLVAPVYISTIPAKVAELIKNSTLDGGLDKEFLIFTLL